MSKEENFTVDPMNGTIRVFTQDPTATLMLELEKVAETRREKLKFEEESIFGSEKLSEWEFPSFEESVIKDIETERMKDFLREMERWKEDY